MNIVEYKINGGKEVYVIETREGLVLESVVDFIKNKSNSKNCTKETTKIYCEYLKIYLEILDRQKHSLDESDVEDLKLFKKELANCDKLRKIKPRSTENLVKRPLDIDEGLCTIFSFHSFISDRKNDCYNFEIKQHKR